MYNECSTENTAIKRKHGVSLKPKPKNELKAQKPTIEIDFTYLKKMYGIRPT